MQVLHGAKTCQLRILGLLVRDTEFEDQAIVPYLIPYIFLYILRNRCNAEVNIHSDIHHRNLSIGTM